jgi:hypothetical protein
VAQSKILAGFVKKPEKDYSSQHQAQLVGDGRRKHVREESGKGISAEGQAERFGTRDFICTCRTILVPLLHSSGTIAVIVTTNQSRPYGLDLGSTDLGTYFGNEKIYISDSAPKDGGRPEKRMR